MWLQRSRIAWLREGDSNTSNFHSQAVWRSPKNHIKKLRNSNGDWCENPQELKEMVPSFFKGLFEADSGVDPCELLDLIEQKVTEDMNVHFSKEFIEREIPDALFQIGPLKAPGPDSFPARFFQRHWDILRYDVICSVKKFFSDGIMPPGINDTTIVLIPKGNNPEELKDFRPISI